MVILCDSQVPTYIVTMKNQQRQRNSKLPLLLASAFVVATTTAFPQSIFFREINPRQPITLPHQLPDDLYWLNGYSNYRLIPGKFPEGVLFHYDGEYIIVALVARTVVQRISSSTVKPHQPYCILYLLPHKCRKPTYNATTQSYMLDL